MTARLVAAEDSKSNCIWSNDPEEALERTSPALINSDKFNMGFSHLNYKERYWKSICKNASVRSL